MEKHVSAKHKDNNELHCACDQAAAPLHDVCREIQCHGATLCFSTVKLSLIRALLRYNVVFTNVISCSKGSLILVYNCEL